MVELPGFMNDGGGSQPVLGQALGNQDWWARLQGVDRYQPAQVWSQLVPRPLWPRSAGFGYTGCNERTCSYFPDLMCNEDGLRCEGPIQ